MFFFRIIDTRIYEWFKQFCLSNKMTWKSHGSFPMWIPLQYRKWGKNNILYSSLLYKHTLKCLREEKKRIGSNRKKIHRTQHEVERITWNLNQIVRSMFVRLSIEYDSLVKKRDVFYVFLRYNWAVENWENFRSFDFFFCFSNLLRWWKKDGVCECEQQQIHTAHKTVAAEFETQSHGDSWWTKEPSSHKCWTSNRNRSTVQFATAIVFCFFFASHQKHHCPLWYCVLKHDRIVVIVVVAVRAHRTQKKKHSTNKLNFCVKMKRRSKNWETTEKFENQRNENIHFYSSQYSYCVACDPEPNETFEMSKISFPLHT